MVLLLFRGLGSFGYTHTHKRRNKNNESACTCRLYLPVSSFYAAAQECLASSRLHRLLHLGDHTTVVLKLLFVQYLHLSVRLIAIAIEVGLRGVF